MTEVRPTIRVNIVQLLEILDLGADFDKTMIKILNRRNKGRGIEAKQFIFSKLDELQAHVSTYMLEPTTMDRLKIIITEWIAIQS